MLFAIDIGNTSIKFNIFDKDKQIAFDKADSHLEDYEGLMQDFFQNNNIDPSALDDTIIASVVPNTLKVVLPAIKKITGKEAIIFDYYNYCGIKIDPSVSDEVGADILVMCAYAYSLCQKECLIISMGTATVLAHVDENGVFRHCIIAPGFNKLAQALWSNAALLPEFDINKQDNFLANNTIDAMSIGVYDGYIGMLSHLIEGICSDIAVPLEIYACGGYGRKVVPYIPELKNYQPDLVSLGLNYLYNRYFHE